MTKTKKQPPLVLANDKETPQASSQLSQLYGRSSVFLNVGHVIGAYTPGYVTHDVRLLMRNDPDVAFALAIVRAPIINLGWSVESRDPEIAAFVEAALRPRYRQLALAGSRAIPFGASVVAKVWEARKLNITRTDLKTKKVVEGKYPAAWVPARFKAIDQRTCTVTADPQTDDWKEIEQSYAGKKVKVDKTQAILWSFRREDVDGLIDGYPLLDQSYSPWWWKQAMQVIANRYFERRGDPSVLGRGEKELRSGNKTIDGFEYMGEQINQLRSGGTMMLPNSRDASGQYRYTVEFLQDDKRGDMLQQYIESLSVQIMRGMWIADRAATTGSTGARAEAEVHADVVAAMLDTIVAEWVDEVVNPQVIDDIVRFNFGQEAVDSSGTRLKTKGLSSEMRVILGDLLKSMLQAEQLLTDGKKVSLSDMIDGGAVCEQLGIPIRSADELEEMKASDEEEAANQPPPPADDVALDPEAERAVADNLKKRGVMKEDDQNETPGQ